MKQFKPSEVIKFLEKHGWAVDHIRGSHHVMRENKSGKITIVAVHKKDLPIGTLMAILKQTGFTKDDLIGN